jgi:hypothetical protein
LYPVDWRGKEYSMAGRQLNQEVMPATNLAAGDQSSLRCGFQQWTSHLNYRRLCPRKNPHRCFPSCPHSRLIFFGASNSL